MGVKLNGSHESSLQTLVGWGRGKVYPQGCWAPGLAWPLQRTTDGHSLSVALTADTGRDFCTLPSPQRVCTPPRWGPLGQPQSGRPPAVWHLTYEESRPRAHPRTPPPQRGARLAGGLSTLRKRIPRALISLPCVRGPLMGIPLPPLSSPRGLAGGREEGD